jgi:hypothetical protein
VWARIKAPLLTVDIEIPGRIRLYDIQKLVDTLKLKEVCGIDGIPNECFRQFIR